MYIINFVRGFCMALADSVPGVSGGTIAFILGFYDQFIGALDNLISGKKEKKIDAIKFLIKIGIGWMVGFILAVLFLGQIFDEYIYKISSLFIGFIFFAIPIIIKEEKEVLRSKYSNIIFALIGIAIVWAITFFNPTTGENGISIDNISLGVGLYIFLCAMIAISAMVLPGISGSTLLLIFGLYVPIINAIKEIIQLNFSYLKVIIIFGLGILTGILSIIKIVRIVLEKYRAKTIYLILGLMIGSIYAVIMGPRSLEIPKMPMTLPSFSWVFFMIGGLVILGLQKLKKILQIN